MKITGIYFKEGLEVTDPMLFRHVEPILETIKKHST